MLRLRHEMDRQEPDGEREPRAGEERLGYVTRWIARNQMVSGSRVLAKSVVAPTRNSGTCADLISTRELQAVRWKA